MKTGPIALLCVLPLLAVSNAASADPWKDESGHGRWRGGYEREAYGSRSYRFDRYRAEARIPRGHLPPRGECRVWHPHRPAGHQPPPFKC